MVVAFIQEEYILLEMRGIIKEAIDVYVNNNSQLNLDAEVSRANLAEFIEDYIISENYIMDEFEKEDNEDCCGNDCGCH